MFLGNISCEFGLKCSVGNACKNVDKSFECACERNTTLNMDGFFKCFCEGDTKFKDGKCVKTGVKTGKFLLFFNQKQRNILYKRMVWKTNFTRILYLRGKIDEKHAEIL